jgi:hypothetical protein
MSNPALRLGMGVFMLKRAMVPVGEIVASAEKEWNGPAMILGELDLWFPTFLTE